MASIRFKSVIEIRGVNPYILINESRARTLQQGWHKPMPVSIRVNGKPDNPWHINMMPVGNGDFYLYLDGTVRKASHTKVDDPVTVEVTFDGAYRSGPLTDPPKWFEAALEKNPVAMQNWQNLSPSRQKEVVRYFVDLKSQEAQHRNLEKIMRILSGEPGRFMGRDWKDGK
jgi:hypothetical protein